VSELPDPATLQAIAREVANLLREPTGLMTVREAAMMLGVSPEWIYEHADDLGVIRLGDGERPRLRFDPAVVRQRIAPATPTRHERVINGSNDVAPLLPIRPTHRRRLGAD
jgi:hypothetical protein